MKAYGITLLRVAVGAVYLLHAYRLFRGATGAAPAALARTLNVQDPSVVLWVLLLVEGLGGLLILAGLFTRPAAAVNALVGAITLVQTHLPLGSVRISPSALELPVLLLAATVTLMCLGSGPAAVRPSR